MNGFPWRILVYLAFLLYLFLDLRVCRGPLHDSFRDRTDATLEAADRHGWVALVNQEPITRAQLDLTVFRHLYQRGDHDDPPPEKTLAMIRRAVLNRLIDDTLIRQYADGEGHTAPKAEIDAFIRRWEMQFDSAEDLAERSHEQGLSEEERRAELARIWSRKRWVEKRVAPGVEVTEEDARRWFEANRPTGEGFVEPEKVRARHLFVSTVETDDEEHEQLIRDLHARLLEGEATFEELAAMSSEDPRTAKRGGDLGWFTRDRIPSPFAEIAFGLDLGEVSEPFRTDIGWHVVEVTDRQPERPVTFDEAREEIRAHLENQRTAETVAELLRKLRKVSNIRVFPDRL